MSLSGIWQNSFGSVMDLSQDSTGQIIGLYSSTTGSSGTYWVVGAADPASASQDKGQACALAILWRSIAGGKPDESWHWVSGFSGQLSLDSAGAKSLILMHAMVDSDDTPGVGGMGIYIDKLIYTPKASQEASAVDGLADGDAAQNPILGTWVGAPGSDLRVTFNKFYDATGYATGTLEMGGVSYPAQGFSDPDASADGLALQSVSVCAFDAANETVLSLSGSLNLADGRLTLLGLTSHGTAPDNAFAQTTIAETIFTKSA